jgi:hypothetical protein
MSSSLEVPSAKETAQIAPPTSVTSRVKEYVAYAIDRAARVDGSTRAEYVAPSPHVASLVCVYLQGLGYECSMRQGYPLVVRISWERAVRERDEASL